MNAGARTIGKLTTASLLILIAVSGLSLGSIVGQDGDGDDTDEQLPIGLALSAEIKGLVAERIERVHELTLDHRLRMAEQHDERLQVISEHQEQMRGRVTRWQQEFQDLTQRFQSGEITRTEFQMERQRLRTMVQEEARLFEHLGRRLQETLGESQGGTENLGRRVSAANREIANSIGQIRSELQQEREHGRGSGQGRGNGNGNSGE